MTWSFLQARAWMEHGTQVILGSSVVEKQDYDVATALPGWTRKHVVAHLAANADALCNLVSWAATGRENPMYSSPQARTADIDRGSRLSAPELTSWLHGSAERLRADMNSLDPDQWAAHVVSAQGRSIPATELPWMRDRELYVHGVDIDAIRFVDVPADFRAALTQEIAERRRLTSLPDGPDYEVVAWLTGRPHNLPIPDLDPWL